MASLNKVILIGHMTADPELKQTANGVNVCSFSIGVARKFTRGEQAQTDFIRTTAVETFKALNCDGVARIDFMIDESCEKIYVNEINTIPGSLSFYLWEATGVSFPQLIERLIAIAFERKRDSSFKTTSYKENIFNYSISGAKGAKGAKR